MSHGCFQKKWAVVPIILILAGVVWTGCSTVQERPADAIVVQDTGEGKYYFFDDVLVPKELNYKPGKSFVYETTKLKAGSLFFSGWWMEIEPLMQFFTDHMLKDKWKLANSFRGKEYVLNFSKPDKTCSIRIVDTWYGFVDVEIRVGPLA
jgi:hypothetical protein